MNIPRRKDGTHMDSIRKHMKACEEHMINIRKRTKHIRRTYEEHTNNIRNNQHTKPQEDDRRAIENSYEKARGHTKLIQQIMHAIRNSYKKRTEYHTELI